QIKLCHVVYDIGPNTMHWDIYVDFFNNSDSWIRLSHYLYTDLDLFATPPDDRAAYNPAGPEFVLTDTVLGGNFSVKDISGAALSHFEIGAFPTVRAKISGAASAIALSDMVSPFLGDFTGAMQHDMTLPPGGTASVAFMISGR